MRGTNGTLTFCKCGCTFACKQRVDVGESGARCQRHFDFLQIYKKSKYVKNFIDMLAYIKTEGSITYTVYPEIATLSKESVAINLESCCLYSYFYCETDSNS